MRPPTFRSIHCIELGLVVLGEWFHRSRNRDHRNAYIHIESTAVDRRALPERVKVSKCKWGGTSYLVTFSRVVAFPVSFRANDMFCPCRGWLLVLSILDLMGLKGKTT